MPIPCYVARALVPASAYKGLSRILSAKLLRGGRTADCHGKSQSQSPLLFSTRMPVM